ncbi:hypothetical protein HXP44_14170 [Streptomyces sioyaensis]|uniref:WXG100 family type VII secretion target n=1 Tax=Streptomyces sioyaensis TaxID=67364 RepID=A0A4Q1QQK9_9ACTN|nr:hypothetical protein [Streptomyces sioyaensis]MBM4793167.1 hypothetical protein [Streptomyces sioyaensis]RXS57461.1 hypothetical protein EST54_32820 [Streptomyces sioyaensis]
MASNDSKFKPAEVHVPKDSGSAPTGSGAAQEQSYEIGKSRPQFTKLRLNQVKQMVEGSNPGEVGNVAEGWKLVRIKLVGGGNDWTSQDWHDGIKKKFDDAVTKVLETWHGRSADQFAAEAQKISNNFAKLAAYPHNTGYVLHQISERLATVKKAVEGVEEPSEWERVKDRAADGLSSGAGKGAAIGNTLMPGGGGALVGGLVGGMVGGDGRDDSQLNADLANPKMSIFDAVNKNRGSLSIDRERELEAAHYMEQLATTYRAGVSAIGSGPRVDEGGRIKDPDHSPDGGGFIPPIGPYGPTPGAPKPGVGGGNTPGMKGPGYTTPPAMEPPRPHGIDGGIGSMPKAPAPHVGTGLDGLSGGSGLGTGGGAGGIGGGAGTGGLGAGSGSVGAGSGPGVGGSGAPGMVGGIGAAGSARAGGTGAGVGSRGGRAGMPGMGGAAGAGKGAGAKGAGAGGKGSALARQKGGVVGGKGGKLGAAGQGGSGLHRSRGGTQQGATGGRRPAGMAGAHGAHGAKGKDKGGENGQRPDYLVEEEETWTPERNVAPKVIE